MSSLLLLLAISLSVEVLLALRPQKYVRLTAGAVFCAGVFLSLLCVLAPWISLLYTVCCCVLCAVQFKKIKVVPAALGAVVSLVITLIPGARELLYLDCRYADHFTYVAAGICHSAVLDCNILVDLKEGDTYQSALYERLAIASCASVLPSQSEVAYAYVEPQKTTYLASSFEDYVRVLNPTVYMGVELPEYYTGELKFPLHCVLEITS